MFVDIHTHSVRPSADTVKVVNHIVQVDDRLHGMQDASLYRSAGIHPWHLSQENGAALLERLTQLAARPSITFIGECGIDKLRGPSLAYQADVFVKQLELAIALNKPVIIHCVKAFNELEAVLRKVKPSVPVIIHGFNGKVELGRQLSRLGVYFSFGAALLNSGSNAVRFMAEVAEDRFFLETDTADIHVSELYNVVAGIRNVDSVLLKADLYRRFLQLKGEG